jgi:hypothetical protein
MPPEPPSYNHKFPAVVPERIKSRLIPAVKPKSVQKAVKPVEIRHISAGMALMSDSMTLADRENGRLSA